MLAAGSRLLREKMDFPPVSLMPKQTVSCPVLEVTCTRRSLPSVQIYEEGRLACQRW